MRLAWKTGNKQMTWESIFPFIALPTLALSATLGPYYTISAFAVLFFGLCFLHHWFMKNNPKTKFYLYWTIASSISILLVFEIFVVPQLEILPEENIILVVLIISSIYLAYQVKHKGELNCNTYNSTDVEESSLSMTHKEYNDLICVNCKRKVPPKSHHCKICQICIPNYIYHCLWLDCCIGQSNRKEIIFLLILSCGALLYAASLTLTTICFPYYFLKILLLPQDCSDVYHEFEFALCFVTGIYCILLATVLFGLLLRNFWLILCKNKLKVSFCRE